MDYRSLRLALVKVTHWTLAATSLAGYLVAQQ